MLPRPEPFTPVYPPAPAPCKPPVGLSAPGSRPRFTHEYSQVRSLHLISFVLQSSNSATTTTHSTQACYVYGRSNPVPFTKAETQLMDLTNISIEATLPFKKWKVRNNYKEK